jgi:hypothetical protein
MAETWTIGFLIIGAGLALVMAQRRMSRESVAVRLRLDRSAPGAHLMWDIANVGQAAITVNKLVLHVGRGPRNTETVALGMPQVLQPREHALIPTDVDWTLLSAKAIAVADADDREHPVSKKQLARIQQQLRLLIDRRDDSASANDWLFGATNLAFGVVILGLGVFMLMWVIATG